MTDFNQLDPFRRKADPVQLDLVESFAQGKVSRKQFIQRGTVIGLSLASLSAIIAACGGSDSGSGDGAGGAAVETAEGAASEATTAAAKTGGSMKWGMSILGSEGVNPITMVDLVTYNVTAQTFEYLVRSAADLSVQPQLATEWSGSADAKEWTFKLRDNAVWPDGTPLTSKDVVATMDNLVDAGNSALNGVLAKGGTEAVDDTTVKFTLEAANGLFPYLVSSDNTQSQITPAGWTVKDNLGPDNGGTGPWKLTSIDKTSAKYVRNDKWWGGATPMDSIEFVFIEDPQAQVAALAAGEIDGIPQFPYDVGEVLFNNPDLNIVELKSATHREVWMRVDKGTFADKRVRQALALTFDREKMVEKLLGGRGSVANDQVIFDLYPYFDAEAAPQRTRDVEAAKALLAEAGVSNLTAELNFIKGQEMPGLATLIKEGAAEAGITLNLKGGSYETYYGKHWCPSEPADPPCSGASELGIVDYGHRGTPNVYLNAALSTGGVWNSSQYANEEFDAAFAEFQAAVDVDGQKAAAGKLIKNVNDETPVGIGYTISALAAYSKKYQGVANTAMGFTFLESAGQV